MLLDPSSSYTLSASGLQQRHKMSPYLGMTFSGVVRRTIRRGETICVDGKPTGTSKGRYVRPHH
jgi:dihydroorotase-like cyclic amidohydrolase